MHNSGSVYHASKIKNNTANKYYRSRNSKVVTPELPSKKLVTELTCISSNNGYVDFETNVMKNLVASSSISQTFDASTEITKITRLNEKYDVSSLATPIDLEDKREQRKTNSEFKKEFKKSLKVAQNDSQQSAVKPAMPLAIASLVLGITSFIIFAIPAGTLAIVFGAIALSRIKKNPDLLGRGMAIAGLVCGIVGMGLWLILLASMV